MSALVFLQLISDASNAQTGRPQYNIPKIEDLVKIPSSPEAQAFARYGNTPANIYSGTPNISIPIANLKAREIEVPISLTYDASGVKVEQISTWVGLGWNLNVGGMVTRQVNGLPDDYFSATPLYVPFYDPSIKSDFEFTRDFNPAPLSVYGPGMLARYFNFMYQATRTTGLKYEIQPDTYSFNVLGLSGTLFIDYNNNTAYCIESPEIKATPIINQLASIKVITGWEIVDGSGNTYFFGNAERTHVRDNDPDEGSRFYNSAWVLTKIETKNKRDVIAFEYSALPMWEREQLAGRAVTRNSFNGNNQCGTDNFIVNAEPTYQIEQMELTRLSVNSILRAEFIPGALRSDLMGKRSLSQILIRDTNGSLVNTYQLNQTYFGSPSTVEKELRLRLDNLEMYGTNDPNPQRHTFYYLNGNLPSRESMAQDFWGYYNGQVTNTSLIPYNYDFDFGNLNFIGANRQPNFATTLTGTLNRIKYPTGGFTEFYYQPHSLPPNSYSYKEDYLIGSAGLIGGSDPNDPMRYFNPRCDDLLTTPPKGTEQSFQVTKTEPTRLKVYVTQANPNGNQAGNLLFIALYYTGADGHQVRSFCDLYNNGNTLYHLTQTTVNNYVFEIPLDLALGHYRIMIVNSNPAVTATVEIIATRTINVTNQQGAGLRVHNIRDIKEDGYIVSNRYFYYGDLRSVSPATITEGFVSSASANTIGTLHAEINFEEARSTQIDDGSNLVCTSVFRNSSNRVQSNHFITYPIVSEIAFDNAGNNAGFTVTRFYDNIDNFTGGFSKKNLLNGKVKQKWIFDNAGKLLTQERNYHSQGTVVPGTVGFYFSSNKSTFKDVTVKAYYNTPNEEFYIMENPSIGGSMAHCAGTGIEPIVFNDSDYHLSNNSHPGSSCSTTLLQDPSFLFNQNHPARIKFFELLSQGIPDVSTGHANLAGIALVNRRVFVIPYCRFFGQEYKKNQYLYSRWWPKLDSTVSVQYSGTDSLLIYTRNLYENANHFQITQIRQRNSKGVVKASKLYYPHELQLLYPSDPWFLLVAQNRIVEPARIEATIGNNVPDFVKQTRYKSSIVSNNTIILPDKVQFSSGTGPLEDRIQYHLYDGAANPIEVSRTNDMRTSFIWGYNKQELIAEAKNASANEIFHTSFENEEGGNSTDGDSRTGLKSKTDGYAKTLSGLTPNKAYVLTYWQKSATVWTLQTVNIAASASTTYTINLTGQVDEVRFFPQGALMTTYTYKSGVGISSVCDPKGLITTFEYDSFNRLWLVKDHFGNILKENKYNYKQ
ncbi:MAG: hypothetical protein ING88_16785 [Cytophagales bacterium]|nr:hypothetical protein [Cytophagales bacterium]